MDEQVVKERVEDVVETVVGAVNKAEDAVEVAVGFAGRVSRIVRSRTFVVSSVVGVAGALGAAGVSYLVTRRKLKIEVDTVEEQLKEMQAEQLTLNFERIERDREFNEQISKAVIVTRELKDLGLTVMGNLQQLQTGSEGVDEPVVEEVVHRKPAKEIFPTPPQADAPHRHNIFEGTDGWDYEAERNQRSGEEPYIIHIDEFVTQEMGYEQETITWYEGDEVLVDQREVPIYDHTKVVGEIRFGHGSNDPNIVYVRNEKLRMEYEILRDTGSYSDDMMAKSVAGQFEEADLKHFNRPGRFRDD